MSKYVLWVFLAGFVLRLMLLVWSVPLDINGDQRRYEDWAQTAHIYSLADTYSGHHTTTVVNNEPPGTLYIFSATYESYIVLGKLIAKLTHTEPGSIQFVNSYLLHLMMRLPSILTDFGMGFLAYLLVRREKGEKKAALASGLILLNPVVLWNSSVWGQTDSLNNFFFLLSLFLAFRKNYILSIISYTLSLYIKLSLLPLVPFYVVFLFFHSGKNWKQLLGGGLLSLVLIVLATLPIASNPLSWLLTTIPAMSGGELQNITVAAFNFWWMVTCGPITCPQSLPVIADTFMGITLNAWGYLLFATATLPILYLQLRSAEQMTRKQYVFFSFALVTFALFLFLPKMHDRYLYPFFPLIAVAIGLSKHYKRYMVLVCLLAVIYMGNLIYSEYPTRFPAFVFYQILYSNPYRWGISAAVTLLGAVIYYLTFPLFLNPQNQALLKRKKRQKER
jgi:Gpi18-like mannosyltransferase